MCDQVVAMLSSDDTASVVWNEDDEDGDTSSAVDIDAGDSKRLFTFEVAKTNEQEESVASRTGFRVRLTANLSYYL